MITAVRGAPNFVTYTTAVQLRIKQLILRDILNGVPRDAALRKVKKIIEAYGKRITDAEQRKKYEQSLARGAVKIYGEIVAQIESTASVLELPFAVVIAAWSGKKTELQSNSKTAEITDGAGKQPTELRELIYPDRIELPQVRKQLKEELARLIATLANEDIKDRNGASLRLLAEINVRHEAQQSSIEQMRANGVKLVWASTHVDCSARCFPWQGRLYSLDGSYGTVKGIKYEPLENAVNVPYTTKAGKTYMNGLLGFNCRHRLIPYKDEHEPPKGYTKAETVKAYRLDLKQREMETAIRKVKERAHLLKGVDSATSSQMFARARAMTEAYRKFCRDNDRVAMIYRTQVTVEEQRYNKKRNKTD